MSLWRGWRRTCDARCPPVCRHAQRLALKCNPGKGACRLHSSSGTWRGTASEQLPLNVPDKPRALQTRARCPSSVWLPPAARAPLLPGTRGCASLVTHPACASRIFGSRGDRRGSKPRDRSLHTLPKPSPWGTGPLVGWHSGHFGVKSHQQDSEASRSERRCPPLGRAVCPTAKQQAGPDCPLGSFGTRPGERTPSAALSTHSGWPGPQYTPIPARGLLRPFLEQQPSV